MNKSVDNYFIEGCGRCALGGTPACKVHKWADELKLLQMILQSTKLKEECKWGCPCYTYNNKNVVMLAAFNSYCAISFFKGALLEDTHNILVKPGENSQASRMIKIWSIEDIKKVEKFILPYIQEAIKIEEKGVKIEFKKRPEPIPSELEQIMKEDIMLKEAFDQLTPGRQRGYIIYFSSPKQSKTRISRIEKCIPKILKGEGLHDKYKGKKK